MSELTPDENLKSIFAATPECIDARALASLIEGEAEHSEPAGQHIGQCAYCEGELSLIRSFFNPRITAEEKPHIDAILRELRKGLRVNKRGPWWKSFLAPRTLGPVLTAAALAVVAFVNTEQRRIGEVVLKPGDEVTRSQVIQIVSPVGDLDRVPETFIWKPAAGASSYRFRMVEVDRTPVWTKSTTATQVSIPSETRARIAPGKPLLWQIEALDLYGNVIASSELTRFRWQLPR